MPSTNRFWPLALLLLPVAASAATQTVKFSAVALHAQHTSKPHTPASRRLTAKLENKIQLSSHWSAVIGGRGWLEGVYENDEYPETLDEDAREMVWRDAYLQYQGDHILLRAGNQQVVWGEAFGLLFSDIINPKDFRDGGFGDPSEVRRQSPILNIKLIFKNFSVQGVYVAQPRFHILPLPGSDFAYPYKNKLPLTEIEVHREESLPISSDTAEYGGRLNVTLGALDLSAYYFSYFDRNPYYSLNPLSAGQRMILDERHGEVDTAGFTATMDFDGSIARLEFLNTADRVLPSLSSSGVLGAAILDETVSVIGIDLPTWRNLNTGFQISDSTLSDYHGDLLRPQSQTHLSMNLLYSFSNEHSAGLTYSYVLDDQGHRLQGDYMIPVTNWLEGRIGINMLEGPNESEFGQLRRATRVYVSLTSFFTGKYPRERRRR